MHTFTCPRHAGNLTLTPLGCATMWQRARGGKCEVGDALYPCRGCEIGARHAGQPEAMAERQHGVIDRICVRCHRNPSRFVWGRVCPSCYNRELEFIKGRNAKGTRPVRLAPLYAVRVAVLDGTAMRTVVVDRVTSTLEAELTLVRSSSRRLAFVRPIPPAPVRQMTLFGGL